MNPKNSLSQLRKSYVNNSSNLFAGQGNLEELITCACDAYIGSAFGNLYSTPSSNNAQQRHYGTSTIGYIDNSYPSVPAKPPNMVDYCRRLEQADQNLFSRSVRVHIPRVLIALYEVRSNRGVGHTGGDVNPNHMDSAYVLFVSKWVMAELIRVFHNVSTSEATQAVDAITERTLPLIWEIGDNKRVLMPNMELKDKCLALLFVSPHPVLEADLVRWVEPASPANFRRDFSLKYHKEKLIEFDKTTRMITLSPLGAKYVEQNIPLEL